MKRLGIRSIVSSKFPPRKSGISDKEKTLIVNLIKNLKITHINQVWTTDITYINTKLKRRGAYGRGRQSSFLQPRLKTFAHIF